MTSVNSSQQRSPSALPLTKRQLECLQLVRDGKSSVDIGIILGISEDVVREHVVKACKRLGVRTRMQAVISAINSGFIE